MRCHRGYRNCNPHILSMEKPVVSALGFMDSPLPPFLLCPQYGYRCRLVAVGYNCGQRLASAYYVRLANSPLPPFLLARTISFFLPLHRQVFCQWSGKKMLIHIVGNMDQHILPLHCDHNRICGSLNPAVLMALTRSNSRNRRI